MTTYATQNPLGSSDPRDLYDNAENLDSLVNGDQAAYNDRLGKSRRSWQSVEDQVNQQEAEFNADQIRREGEFDTAQTYRANAFQSSQDDREGVFNAYLVSAGYQFAGDYAAGIEVTQYNQVVRDTSGEFWRLSGSTTLPYTTTGAGLPEGGAFVAVGDAVLRQDLANPDKGAAMVARGVVAVDSIADLLALPEGQRKEGLRYLVKGYHAGSDVGGGEFYWDSTKVLDNDHGTVIFGFVRITDGKVASPYWFGIPLESSDVDYTQELQRVISHPTFAFPRGFKASVNTLNAKSNTTGYFFDAELTLLSGADNYSLVLNFDNDPVTGAQLENVHYYGGVLDGNRGAESGLGQGGQDGGLHCIRIYSGRNCSWEGVICRNAATDGIYVNENRSGYGGKVSSFLLSNPVCDNNSRQGISVINASLLVMDSPILKNTNGKMPQAGLDIEPNLSGESVNVVIRGKAQIYGNAGRGLIVDASLGGDQEFNVLFEHLSIHSNSALISEKQSVRLTGSGRIKFKGDTLICDDLFSLGSPNSIEVDIDNIECRAVQFAGFLGESTFIRFSARNLLTVGPSAESVFACRVQDAGEVQLAIDNAALKNNSVGLAATFPCASFAAASKMKGYINAEIHAPDNINSSRLVDFASGDFSEMFCKFTVNEESAVGEAVRVRSGVEGLNLEVHKTVADGNILARIDGSFCNVKATWDGADAEVVRSQGGSRNTFSVKAVEATNTIVGVTAGLGPGNSLISSHMHRSDGGTLVNLPQNMTISGCVPVSINTLDPRYQAV